MGRRFKPYWDHFIRYWFENFPFEGIRRSDSASPRFFCVETALQSYAFFPFSPNISPENRRNGEDVPPMRLKHRSVPSSTISPRAPLSRLLMSQSCLAAAPLRTERSNLAPNPVVPSVSVAAMFGCSSAFYQAEQSRRRIALLRANSSYFSSTKRFLQTSLCCTPSELQPHFLRQIVPVLVPKSLKNRSKLSVL